MTLRLSLLTAAGVVLGLGGFRLGVARAQEAAPPVELERAVLAVRGAGEGLPSAPPKALPAAPGKGDRAVYFSSVADGLAAENGFAVVQALAARAKLGLTPRQVTRLQLLQAEFLVAFAPLREAYETR